MEEALANASWLQSRREAAWAHGRERRDRLLSEYQQKYRLAEPPPPAKVVDAILTELLNVKLYFDPLDPDRFAETRFEDGRAIVTVNSELGRIEGVKDETGVANVAMWHEVIHVTDDVDILLRPASAQLPGFDEPPSIVCYRTPRGSRALNSDRLEREFWAEEAGRAAAISHEALRRTESFQELMRAATRARGPVRSAWPLLYKSATAIGVNITALVRQLELEGRILKQGKDIFVQAGLGG